MKNLFLGSACAVFLAVSSASASLVYNNSTSDSDLYYSSFNEFGDEVVLAGTDRYISEIRFEYFGQNFNANEGLRLRIYANNGPAFTNDLRGGFGPGQLLYDNGADVPPPPLPGGFYPIGPTSPDGTVLIYNFSANPIFTPTDHITWTVQFAGVNDNNEDFGLKIYGPPTVGGGYPDYWERNAGTWENRVSTNNIPISFGARIEAVPEPSTIGLGILSISALVFGFRRRK
jgi:hypothetical protein